MDIEEKKKVVEEFGEWLIRDIEKEMRKAGYGTETLNNAAFINDFIKRGRYYLDEVLVSQ